MIRLIDPIDKYIKEYGEAYFLSIEEIKKGNTSLHDLIFYNPKEVDVIDRILKYRDENNLSVDIVPSYNYFCVKDDNLIGVINIRTRLTDELLNYGGHIGYGINPKYWKMGYGTKLLSLGLEKAKNLVEDNSILITCDDDNIASCKIIEKNGGVLENKVLNNKFGETFLTRRYWINKKNL